MDQRFNFFNIGSNLTKEDKTPIDGDLRGALTC
jgi:hypothetical protein